MSVINLPVRDRSGLGLRRTRGPGGGAADPVLRPAAGGDHRAAGAGRDHRRCRVGQDHRDGCPGGLAGGHRRGASRGGARPHLHPQGGRRAVAAGPVRAGTCRGGARRRCRCRRRAADHDVRRVRGPAGGRARPATRLRDRSDDDHRGDPLPAGVARGSGGGRPVRAHLPAPAGHRDRAGAAAGRRSAAAPRLRARPRPARPRPPAGARRGTAEPQRQRVRRPEEGRRGGARAAGAGQPGGGLPAAQAAAGGGRVRRPDGDRRSARPGGPGGQRAGPLGVPGRAAGRVPGHLGGAGEDAARTVLRRHPE